MIAKVSRKDKNRSIYKVAHLAFLHPSTVPQMNESGFDVSSKK
jgi:hypothetical protein